MGLVVGFVSVGLGLRAIFSSGPPEFIGSAAMTVRAISGHRFGGPLMTLRYLLIQVRRLITRGRAVTR
jgi:hypothetical protein